MYTIYTCDLLTLDTTLKCYFLLSLYNICIKKTAAAEKIVTTALFAIWCAILCAYACGHSMCEFTAHWSERFMGK